jgi:plastocyanin
MRISAPSVASVAAALMLTGLAAALALGLVLPGSAPASAQAQGTGQPVVIEMGEQGTAYFYNPKDVTVPAGTVRFTFRNAGSRNHNYVIRLPGGEQRIPDLGAGQTREQSFTLTQPGTYNVLCDLPTHAQRGMTGTLIVTAATGGAPGAATTPAPATGSGASSGTGGGASTSAAPAGVGLGGSPGGLPLFISLAIHIPAAIAWLGIVLYQAIVVAVPFLSPAQRGELLARPKWLAIATIPIFTATGIYQTIYNPISPVTDIASLEALRNETSYGLALFLKHGFVMASMALTLALSFWFAPRLATLGSAVRTKVATSSAQVDVDTGPSGSSGASPFSLPALVAWANVAACVALLACVSVIVFQLH